MADLEEPMRSLEDRLRDIRISKSQTQNGNRTILESIEATLKENNEKQNSTSYFVSLLSVLELFSAEDDAQNLTSTVYLLDLVAPHVSKPLLQGKFDDIATKLINTLAYEKAEAPLLRSSIGFIKTLLLAQDFAAWQNPRGACRALMEALIQLGVDQRPKVRKEAQSIITTILKTPPNSPKLEHPAGAYCARDSLTLVQKAFTSMPKGGKDHKQAISNLTHALSLVKAVTLANCWPADHIDQLCKVMLEICRTKEEFLVTSAFGVLETIFSSIQDESAEPKFVKCLETILELQPSHNDVNIAPVWLGAVAQAGGAYAAFQPQKALARLPSLFTTVAGFMESENQSVQTSAAQCLVALAATAIDDEVLLLANKSKSTEKVLAQICKTVYGMLDIKYISAWNETMEVLIALYRKLRWRANPHLIDALKVIAALRTVESSADRRESTDRAIGEAIAALGPEVVLEHMPLNLQDKNGGRAWLLPLLRDNIVYAKLGYFISDFVPLAEWLKQKAEELEIEAGSDGKGPLAMQAKIYSTLFDQVWSLLPRFMTLPIDLKESFTNEFGETLGQQMYEEPQLRHLICNSFSLMIESNEVHAAADELDEEERDILLLERFPAKAASENIKYIAENFSQKIMPMLFNVFMNTKTEQRSYVLECLEHFLRITPDAAIAGAFTEVYKFMKGELDKEAEGKKTKTKFDNSMLLSFLDIVIVLAVYLPEQSMDDLAQIFSTFVSREDEPLYQKKAFRIISSMSKSEIGSKYIRSHISILESRFIEIRQKVGQSARAARLQAVGVLIETLPSDHLAFISSMLPETILSTTAQNEKTRGAAFNLLLEMAEKMKTGGQIDMSQIPGMGEEDAGVSEASLSEFIMMACGGLVSDQISMISATVAALSRLVFEFRDEIDMEILEKLIDLINPLLRGKSQEVAKITLGFTKIVISLPSELIEPQLEGLIETMLVWSHGSKCRSRVKHIIQRLTRRFGYEKMKTVFPEKDIKLLENIRKSRERAKRQAAAGKEPTANGAASSKTSKYDNEFERQLYGSSEEESSDDEQQQPSRKGERYIVEGEDEPMDLLDSKSMARISSSKPKQQKGARTLKNKFGKDQSGKIVVKEQDSDDEIDLNGTGGVDAYQQAVRAGPVKGQRGRLKYKRSRKHQEESDDESDGEPASSRKQATASSSKTQNRPRKQLPKRRKL